MNDRDALDMLERFYHDPDYDMEKGYRKAYGKQSRHVEDAHYEEMREGLV